MAFNKRTYSFATLPAEEDFSSYAIPYTLESFTPEEIQYLSPFFSNLDKPVFVVQHLPEEVIGALSSRYSRSTKSLRRMFLSEYIDPILHPENQKGWSELSKKEQLETKATKDSFLEMIALFNKGEGIDKVVNVQRGRKFFDTWLAQYGDDSIAELGGIHMCIEGLSVVATKEIQDKRVGLSPLEKSTRYVEFGSKRPDGSYQYIVPGEVKGTQFEKEYREVMDALFDTYASISEAYVDYIKARYPKGEDETDRSFHNSRAARRYDDIRDLLPFSTQTNVAIFGNGRAFEDLINRLLCHPLGEMRWWGQQILFELEKVVPSFVRRPKSERGAETQYYRRNIQELREELREELKVTNREVSIKKHGDQVLNSEFRSYNSSANGHDGTNEVEWVKLVDFPDDADVEVLARFLYSGNTTVFWNKIKVKVVKLSLRKRTELLARILEERKFGKEVVRREADRFRKVPRSFEGVVYTFEIWGRGGDYRDLHRHRQLTQERQSFTTAWGYDLEKDMLRSPFIVQVREVLERAKVLYKKLAVVSPEAAQYVVPFAYVQHWYFQMTAREIYWIVELRTGPQGRTHYREICQQIAREAKKASPGVFQGVMVDMNEYTLARRESEKKIEKKLKAVRE